MFMAWKMMSSAGPEHLTCITVRGPLFKQLRQHDTNSMGQVERGLHKPARYRTAVCAEGQLNRCQTALFSAKDKSYTSVRSVSTVANCCCRLRQRVGKGLE